ncbi:MAG TPA: hypothetical protein EYP30_03870 [Archaeoglobaceae archaeon]|nr:hypothetical protein [Archaeoglobaceae archaeon]
MKNDIAKFAVVVVAFMALSILVLPSTVTLFAGQHTWYYKEALPCEKCHADVAAEFSSSSNYHPPGAVYPVWEACVLCHQVEPLYPGDVNEGVGKHAATVVACEYCHWQEANAFDNDPHFEFVKTAEQDDLMPNGTEACVACHTHTRIEANFTWMKYMSFGFRVNPEGDRNNPAEAGERLWFATEEFGANGTETHYIWEYAAYSDSNHTFPIRLLRGRLPGW